MHAIRKTILFPAILAIACLVGCGTSGLWYTSAELSSFLAIPGATELRFTTEKGRQVAYYVPPGGDPAQPPQPLIILFPGIGSRALDRRDWVDRFSLHQPAGIMLIDYPGRGQCEGLMRPSHLPQSFAGALHALAQRTGLQRDAIEADIRLIGHSFGTAAALRFAQLYPSRRIILVAPMTSVRQALSRAVGPLAWLIPDNLDNREMIHDLSTRPTRPAITILHGDRDTEIPLSMGRDLQNIAPGQIELIVLPGGTHMSVLTDHLDLIEARLFDPHAPP